MTGYEKPPLEVGEYVIAEGQAQHNCVGSYIKKMSSGDDIVFFIRKKESPDTSFVTAEYRNGGIAQLFYKNNICVQDSKIQKLAKDFADKLNRKI